MATETEISAAPVTLEGLHVFYFAPSPGRGVSIAMSVSVCLYVCLLAHVNKSSAVAEMDDRGHNRHGPKRGEGCCVPFAESWDPV